MNNLYDFHYWSVHYRDKALREASSTASRVNWLEWRKASRAALYALGVVVAVVGALLTGALTAGPAQAEILTVNSTAHPGSGGCTASECTLNEALERANGNGENDTIDFGFGVSGEIQGGFSILDDTPAVDLTINGPGARVLAVNGNNQTRPFTIASGANATIKGLTIKNGNAMGATERVGGGIYNGAASVLTLDKVTVSGNTAERFGGGFFNSNSTTDIRNSIVAGNTAPDGPDGKGNFASQGNNLIGNTSGTGGFVASDLLNRNPLLGPLQNNGGPTDTHALWPGSPAVDRAANTLCPVTDQRGVTPKDGDGNGSVVCDIGAYERSDFSPPKVSSTTPSSGATGVRLGANISATFSEKMSRSTINSETFKRLRVNPDGSTAPISSWSVRLSKDGLKATLDPFGPIDTSAELLAPNTKYKAVVTTGARDMAGNQLDQKPTAGNQQKQWTFTTGST